MSDDLDAVKRHMQNVLTMPERESGFQPEYGSTFARLAPTMDLLGSALPHMVTDPDENVLVRADLDKVKADIEAGLNAFLAGIDSNHRMSEKDVASSIVRASLGSYGGNIEVTGTHKVVITKARLDKHGYPIGLHTFEDGTCEWLALNPYNGRKVGPHRPRRRAQHASNMGAYNGPRLLADVQFVPLKPIQYFTVSIRRANDGQATEG